MPNYNHEYTYKDRTIQIIIYIYIYLRIPAGTKKWSNPRHEKGDWPTPTPSWTSQALRLSYSDFNAWLNAPNSNHSRAVVDVPRTIWVNWPTTRIEWDRPIPYPICNSGLKRAIPMLLCQSVPEKKNKHAVNYMSACTVSIIHMLIISDYVQNIFSVKM